MEKAPAVVGAVQGSALILPQHRGSHAHAVRPSDAYLASVAECLRDPAVALERHSLFASLDAGAARLLDWLSAEEVKGCTRLRGFGRDERTAAPRLPSPRVPSSVPAWLATPGTQGRAVAATNGTARRTRRKNART